MNTAYNKKIFCRLQEQFQKSSEGKSLTTVGYCREEGENEVMERVIHRLFFHQIWMLSGERD